MKNKCVRGFEICEVKKMEKYIKIVEKDVVVGQDGKTGIWYCKELRTETVRQSEKEMIDMNKALNKVNIGVDTNGKK